MAQEHAAHERAQTHSHDAPSLRLDNARALRLAFALTAGVLVLEAVGGLLTGSVALLADAGHMLTDAGALGIALFAARLSTRPRTAQMSFGYGRVEVVAALGNGLLLGGVSVGIALEAVERLQEPHAVAALPMVAIACVGLITNVGAAFILRRADRRDLNVRAAYLHVLGDALGSVAAISAGVVMLVSHVTWVDAVAALLIAGLLVVAAYRLVRESLDVLLEGTPRHLDPEQIAREACAVPGVVSIHDLHIWTVKSGFFAMSAHVDVESGADAERIRKDIHRLLHQRYDVRHTTIQTEEAPLLTITSPAPGEGERPEGAGPR
jgi:cobalt-zinc-cadmium efflux system protein